MMVANWVLLSLVGVFATWASYFHGNFDTIYGLPSVAAAAMLMWIRREPDYFSQRFYQVCWQLSMAALFLLIVPGALWWFEQGALR